MRFVVCVKQVPQVAQIRFDPETRTLVREGVPLQLNSFDRRALTAGLQLRERFGGEVVAVTMGPPQAREVLAECIASGVDRGVHLLDRAFAGSDTLATSRALAAAIKREAFEAILVGKYSLDAETGQVGPEVAELLGIPQVTSGREMTILEDGSGVRVDRELDEGLETIECGFPFLLTCGEYMPRPGANERPTPEQIKAASEGDRIQVLTAADLPAEAGVFGLAGSPTYVQSIYAQESNRDKIVVKDAPARDAAQQLVDYLLERGLFGRWKGRSLEHPRPGNTIAPRNGKSVWVLVETLQDQVRSVTLELLGRGYELSRQIDGQLCALLMGSNVSRHVDQLAAYGADRVIVADDARLSPYMAETFAQIACQAIEGERPDVFLAPSTPNGRDVAPRIAARLGLGLTGDCIGLELDDEGRLVQLKPAFGGNIVAPILSHTMPQMATVRPGVLTKAEPNWARKAEVERLEVGPLKEYSKRVIGLAIDAGDAGVALDDAEVVIGVGSGIGGPQNVSRLDPLVNVLNAKYAASLPVARSDWLPKPLQVGLTGKTIAPALYIGIGISGAFNHVAGIRKAGTIVAINTDPEAPIFKGADFGIVADWTELVPELTSVLEEARRQKR